MAKLACHPSFVIDKPLVHSELGVKPQINSSGGGSMGKVMWVAIWHCAHGTVNDKP